jgi:serine/threonine protein kinase
MWWDEELIETTVNRQFVLSNLRPDEQLRLDEPLGFGDGLTDDTYMEWIEEKAKRIFLILVDIGVPDQIFGVIDDSWDDDDLPVPLDQVERLRLTYDKDEKVERKFFQRQFIYLLRNIQKGELVLYDEDEVVPLELAEKRPVGQVTGLTQSNVDKVHLPGRPDDLFLRRRIPLGATAGRMPKEEFLAGVESMKVIDHDHLTCLWASYIHHDCGYLLLTPVNDSTLKSFLNVTPQSIKILAKQDRRILLLNWLHCLADAVAFLHGKGLSHRGIKPSNVMLDIDNHIFLADSGILPTAALDGEKKGFDKESYEYSAPEFAQRPQAPVPVISPNARPTVRATMVRRQTGPSQTGSVHSAGSTNTATSPSVVTSNDTSSMHTTSTGSIPPSSPTRTKRHSGMKHDPQMADVFSLGTIFLEILTFFFKRASRNFSSHRSAKNKTPGRGGGLPDSSFHKNLGQVESWIATLRKEASKKEDTLFRGISPILDLIEQMILPIPEERPPAQEVQERLYTILSQKCSLGQPTGAKDDTQGRIHCESRKSDPQSEWSFNFDELRLASQRAAAAACASVAPVSTLSGNTGTDVQVIYGVGMDGERISVQSPPSPSLVRGLSERGDRMSIATSKSKSSEGKSGSRAGGSLSGERKVKPKAKAWQAPVYAGEFPFWIFQVLFVTGC